MEKEDTGVRTKSIIECTECNTRWFSTDITRDNSADTCDCGNIMLGITEMTPPTRSADNFFITIKYKTSYPKIYDVCVESEENEGP
jgi:hypothetical protein